MRKPLCPYTSHPLLLGLASWIWSHSTFPWNKNPLDSWQVEGGRVAWMGEVEGRIWGSQCALCELSYHPPHFFPTPSPLSATHRCLHFLQLFWEVSAVTWLLLHKHPGSKHLSFSILRFAKSSFHFLSFKNMFPLCNHKAFSLHLFSLSFSVSFSLIIPFTLNFGGVCGRGNECLLSSMFNWSVSSLISLLNLHPLAVRFQIRGELP